MWRQHASTLAPKGLVAWVPGIFKYYCSRNREKICSATRQHLTLGNVGEERSCHKMRLPFHLSTWLRVFASLCLHLDLSPSQSASLSLSLSLSLCSFSLSLSRSLFLALSLSQTQCFLFFLSLSLSLSLSISVSLSLSLFIFFSLSLSLSLRLFLALYLSTSRPISISISLDLYLHAGELVSVPTFGFSRVRNCTNSVKNGAHCCSQLEQTKKTLKPHIFCRNLVFVAKQ